MFNNLKLKDYGSRSYKSGGEGVIVADRGCNDGCCCNKHNPGLIITVVIT